MAFLESIDLFCIERLGRSYYWTGLEFKEQVIEICPIKTISASLPIKVNFNENTRNVNISIRTATTSVSGATTLTNTVNNNQTKALTPKGAFTELEKKANLDGSNATGTWGINITGNAATATNATNSTNSTNSRVDWDKTSNANRYIVFADSGGSQQRRLKADDGLTYNPSTNKLKATTFQGSLQGNAETATSATSAGSATNSNNSTNVNVLKDTSNSNTRYISFTSKNSGNTRVRASDKIKCNPQTGAITAGGINVGSVNTTTLNATGKSTLKDCEITGNLVCAYVKVEGVETSQNIACQNLTTTTGNVTAHEKLIAKNGDIEANKGNLVLKEGSVFCKNVTATGAAQITGNLTAKNLITTGSVSGNGSALTNLNAGNITTGTLNDDRLPVTISKASNVLIEATGDRDFNLKAGDNLVLTAGTSVDGSIYFRGNSAADTYRFAKSGQTSIEGFLSFQSLTGDRTFTFPNANGTIALTTSKVDSCTNADNADKLDNLNSTQFIRSDADDQVNAHTRWNTSKQLRFGTSATDYSIYHDGNNAVQNILDGSLYFRTGSGNKLIIQAGSSGFVPANDNTGYVGSSSNTFNSGRFTNFNVDNTLTVRGAIDLADNDILRFGSGDDVEFFFNGSNMYMDLNAGVSGGNFFIRDGNVNRFSFNKNGTFTCLGDVVVSGSIQCDLFEVDEITTTGDITAQGKISGSTLNITNNIDAGRNINVERTVNADQVFARIGAFTSGLSSEGIISAEGGIVGGRDLEVGNDIRAGRNITAGGNINSASDIRLKDNIQNLEGSLDKVKQLRGVEYDRNDMADRCHQFGVIAQEIEKVYPTIVDEDSAGIKNVSYTQLIPVLIEAVKELTARVEELESK